MSGRRSAETSGGAIACLLALGAVLAGCGGGGSETPSARHPAPGAAATPARRATGPAFRRLSVPAGAPRRSVRVPILTYHRVHEYATELTKSQPDLTIEPAAFRAQMKALHDGGFHTVTQAQLFDALYRGRALPRRPVLLSFDDGYIDDITQVLPVLRRLRMRATFYVITGRTHEAGFVSARQIRALERAGMDVGDHTRTHANLPALPPAVLSGEVAGSRHDLERILGHPVYWFAYPYGAFDARVTDEVRRSGYLLAVTTMSGTSASTGAPLAIPRIHVGRAATARSVVSLAGG